MQNLLSNNELVILDSLTYYKAFSDSYAPTTEKGNLTYHTVSEFVTYALNNTKTCHTCFNNLL